MSSLYDNDIICRKQTGKRLQYCDGSRIVNVLSPERWVRRLLGTFLVITCHVLYATCMPPLLNLIINILQVYK